MSVVRHASLVSCLAGGRRRVLEIPLRERVPRQHTSAHAGGVAPQMPFDNTLQFWWRCSADASGAWTYMQMLVASGAWTYMQIGIS